MAITCSFAQTLFIDLECVPAVPSFFDLDEWMQTLREKKWSRMLSNWNDDDMLSASDLYEQRSGIFAEFGKIIVISTWILAKQPDWTMHMRMKSFSWDDEKTLLVDFFDMLNTYFAKSSNLLCGHNIKEFDIPYICRRAMVHGLVLPDILDLQGKKPRENNHIDTLELWKFGDRKNFISLDLLCRVLWVQTPKTDISGEQVARVYRDEKDLPRITEYCERDVVAVGEVLLKMMGNSDWIAEVIKV
jgi:3'-5' exonuclease